MQPEMAQEVQAAVPDQAGVQADQGLLFVVGKGKSKEKPEMAQKKPVMAPRAPVHLCPKTLTGGLAQPPASPGKAQISQRWLRHPR